MIMSGQMNDNKFKVIIAGGRDFNDYPTLVKYCDKMLKNKDNIEIISGCARGVDTLGEEYAIEKEYLIKPFPADWNNTEGKPEHEIGYRKDGTKYWKLAGHDRNRKMAEYGDALIAFWDGKSTGTKNMIKTAEKNGLDVRVYKY